MKIYRPDGELWREVVALDSSFCEETLERFGRISLDFVLAEEVPVPELCYVTWRGERYSLFSTSKVVKVSTREYRYTLNLEGRHMELDRVLVKDKLGRTKFVFTGRTDQYAELISGCLTGWKVGACTTGEATRVIAFNNTSLLEACRMVASKFETEVQLTDGAISFGRVERHKADPLLLAYREGLKKDITVEPDPKETAIGRLYVVGGNRNIDPAKYGGHVLHLPKGGKVSVGGRTFVADAEGRYISLEGDTRLNTSERAFDASSIYPKRVGTVSKVEQVGEEWDVLDDANTIDYGQHRVGGDTMRLEFQSGRLAGRTFDLATKDDKLVGYVHSEKRFRLVRKEVDGVLMPEPATFYPAVGDKYAIFGCSLPDEYIKSAEGEMLLKGAEYMVERLEPRLQYRAELDGLWAKKNWGTVAHKLVVGTIVKLEGASSEVRISSVRTSLNSPYTPRITFSNAPYMVGSLATQIATLENAEVRQREELRAGLVKLQDRTYKETEAVREMVERLKVEGFSQSLKPETLQTMYAVIGSPALQFEFVGGGFSWTEGKGGAVTIPKQVIRQRVAGTTLEPDPKTVETTIPALTYTLKAEEQQAYIYTELKPTPRYVVSTKPLEVTPDRLLVGLLHGTEGSRDFTPLYGFTEISPSHIATKLIRSRTGNMLIDLETGTIYSDSIEFRRPDGSKGNLTEAIDTIQKTPGPKGGKGEDGKDATPVRENLFTAKLYFFEQNDLYGAKCTHLGDGRWRVEKIAKSDRTYFDGASFYVSPIRDTKPGRYTISFRVVETSKPIKYLNTTAISKEGATITGDRYISTANSANGRLTGISFYWGETATKGNEIGDYTIIDHIKVERVEEGEDPMPTAYLPHPDDLIGKDGISIKLVDVEYAVNTSAATPPTAGWVTDAPTITGSQQLWTRTKTTYSSGSPTYSKPANITPQKGDAGKSVDSVTEEYAISTSKTTQPTSGWSETQPQWEQGKYIWSRSKIVYKNPASTTYTGYSCSSEWEAINNIQIGGRNLAKIGDPYYWDGVKLFDSSGAQYYAVIDTSQAPHIWQIEARAVNDIAVGAEFGWMWKNTPQVKVTLTKEWKRVVSPIHQVKGGAIGLWCSGRGAYVELRHIKLERGTVATDWTPAPEDVQAETDEAKRLADVAQKRADDTYTKAQADGIITQAEQKAIDVANEQARLAKEYAVTQDKLLKTQQEAYADGKVTKAEQNAIAVAQAKANLAETNAKAYADGVLTEAEKKAIAEAKKAYDDAIAKAKELDDSLKIGGRNLLIASNWNGRLNSNNVSKCPNTQGVDEQGSYLTKTDAQFAISPTLSTYFPLAIPHACYNEEAGNLQEYVTSWEVKVSDEMAVGLHTNDSEYKVVRPSDGWVRLSRQYKGGFTRFAGIYGIFPKAGAKIWFRNPMLLAGNKFPISYSEAPEDVEARYQKLVANIDVEYALATSSSVAPTSGWQTTAPTYQAGRYMWQRTTTTLKDGTVTYSKPTCIQGADGRSIVSVTEQYYHSTSMTTLQGGSWDNSAPTPSDGKWIWTRSVVKYSSGPDTTTQAVCVTGARGIAGTSTIYFGDRKWGSSIFNAYTKMGFSTTWINNLSLPAPKVGDTIWLSITNIETGKSGQLYLLVTQSSTTPTATVISLVMDGKDGAKGAKGDKGDGLDVKDTRNDNQPPKWYRENYKITTVKEFKKQNVVQIPSTWIDGYYCTLETTVNWGDTSGGRITQKAILDSGQELYRVGTSDDTAWGEWSNPEAEIRQGLSNANTLITTLKDATKKLEDGMIKEEDIPDIKWLLDALNDGKTTVAGGLVLTKIIALSNQVDRITAYLSGYDGNNGDGKILRAGIKYDAKERREKTGTERVKVPLVDALEEYWDTDAQIDGFAEVYREKYPTGPNFEALRSQNKAGLDQWLSEGFPNGMAMNNEMLKEIGKKPDFSMDLSAALVKDMYVEYTTDVYTVIPGEDLGTEQVAIRHDGTGHFGEVYFGGDRIDYKESDDSTPYLSIGRMRVKRIESVIDGNDVDTTQALTMKQLTLYSNDNTNRAEDTKTIYVTNDNTAVTFNLDNLTLSSSAPINRPTREVEGAAMYFAAELVVDNTVICRLSGEWIAKYAGEYGSGGNGLVWMYGSDNTSSSQRKSSGSQSVTHVLNSGSHTVKFRVIRSFTLRNYGYDVSASLSGFTVHQIYKSNYRQAIITPSGVRFYGGAGRYIDFDYYGSPALKMKGGFKADYIDTPGIPLCGAMVTSSGAVTKSFGKYKNEQGKDNPRVSYSYNTKSYMVYHSIPHANYIPMLTVSQQNVARSISAINVRAYSFEVEVWTGFSLDKVGFSYVCFLADQPKN